MVIDIFNHIYPRGYINALSKERLPRLFGQFSELGSKEGFAHFVEPEARMKHMNQYRVDTQVLTLANPYAVAEAEKAPALIRIANDEIAKIAEKYPDRFVGCATLPLLNVGEALGEMERCVRDLGMKAVQVFSNVQGKPLDSPEFLPFYEKVVKHDIPILLHPASWNWPDYANDYSLWIMFAWPFDTTLAMARLVFGGILERFPSLKIVTHHLGAMVPHFAERIDCIYEQGIEKDQAEQFPTGIYRKRPIEYFKMFYNDTVTDGSRHALRCAYSFFGPEHIVFGTDYPFGPQRGEMFIRECLASVVEQDIPEEEKQMILEGNARKLLRLP